MAHPLRVRHLPTDIEPAATNDWTRWSGWPLMGRITRLAGKIGAGTGVVLLLLVAGIFTTVAQPYWPMVFGIVAIAGLIGLAGWLSRRFAVVLAILCILLAALVTGTQLTASPSPIVDARGNVVPGSIAEMRTVNLGGIDQWIVIRGRNVNNPILLSLAGGPGESALVLSKVVPQLEDHFVVVNWDQRGAGKSAGVFFADYAHMTPQQYVSDGLQLTNYLRQRFHRDQIYLTGASWGSLLGVWMAQKHPEWYRAYIGVSQVVNWRQMELLEYQLTIQYARQFGDTQVVQTLEANGPPPYAGNAYTILKKDVFDLNYPNEAYMSRLLESAGVHPTSAIPITDPSDSPEYGLAGRVSYYVGVGLVFVRMYEQLLDVDLMTQVPRLDVPVFLASGRLDINTPQVLTEQWYQALQAPSKKLVWFDSGHTIVSDAPTEYSDFMFNTVLAQTQGPGI
jgi:pimeloyl-ACP methyl ester carboxylesterase